MKREKIARDILNEIIAKQGLMGRCAQKYIQDTALANQFLNECYEQCHNQMAVDQWGIELVDRIIKYVENGNPEIGKLNKLRIESYGLLNTNKKINKF